MIHFARKLRTNQTDAERRLWSRLRRRQLDGFKFRRQHPIGPYITDFYCAAARLVVEVDGIAHDMGGRPARDDARAAYLEKMGYNLLRIPASEVLRDVGVVAQSVLSAAIPVRQSLRDCHLPMNGEDL